MIDKLRKKRLVFTVATGRCGTAFFAEILRLVPGTASLHEPAPEYAEVLRDIQKEPGQARTFLLEQKLPVIAGESAGIYIETSHLFCKGFLEPLLDIGIVPSLLWIRRDHRAVASSMYRGGTIPGRSDKGLRFYLSPDDPGVLNLPGWQKIYDYQLCYWYCLEIERRARVYREMYKNKGWYWSETSLPHITSIKGMHQVVTELDLPKMSPFSWLRYMNNRRRRVNPTSKEKQQIVLPDNLDMLEQEVMELTKK